MLGLCDSLQEWHRYAFTSPLRVVRKSLSPSEMDVRANTNTPIKFTYFADKVTISGKEKEFAEYKKKELTRKYGKRWRSYINVLQGEK